MTCVQKQSRINTPYKEIYGSNAVRDQDQTARDEGQPLRKNHRVGRHLRPELNDQVYEDTTSLRQNGGLDEPL